VTYFRLSDIALNLHLLTEAPQEQPQQLQIAWVLFGPSKFGMQWLQLIEDNVSKKNYSSPLDRLFDFINQAIIIIQNLGPNYISQIYRQLLTSKSVYTLSYDRYAFVEIKQMVDEAIQLKLIKSTLTPHEITHMIIRDLRGIIFDWCLVDGPMN
jgi:hypothetical protein